MLCTEVPSEIRSTLTQVNKGEIPMKSSDTPHISKCITFLNKTFPQPMRVVTIRLWAFMFGGSARITSSYFVVSLYFYVKELLPFWKL
jgi:hypothetical protein